MSDPTTGLTTSRASTSAARPRRRATAPHRWDVLLTIAVGGALGAIARYSVGSTWPHEADGFPWATFTINVTGCFAIGILMVVLTEVAGRPHRLVRPFLGVGVLGGFTTFSTYAVDAERLAAGGHAQVALAYLFGTLAGALVAVQLAVFATRFATGVAVRVATRARLRRGSDHEAR